MLIIYLYTGLRRYELISLERENVNLNEGFITVIGKGNRFRRIEIHPTLIPVLESVLKKNDNNTGKYFFGGKNELLCRFDAVSKAFRKFRLKAKLPSGISLHSLRHTFISYLIASGVDVEYVRKIAGHERLSTTQRYIHLIPRNIPQINNLDYSKFLIDNL